MIPDLRNTPICLCAFDDYARLVKQSFGPLRTMLSLDAHPAVFSHFGKLGEAFVELKTATSDLCALDISATLSIPTREAAERETLYKRKPWLRLQDDYNRQKVRRTGRPKKGR